MPEQTLGGIPLGLGMVMINFLNFHAIENYKSTCSSEMMAFQDTSVFNQDTVYGSS